MRTDGDDLGVRAPGEDLPAPPGGRSPGLGVHLPLRRHASRLLEVPAERPGGAGALGPGRQVCELGRSVRDVFRAAGRRGHDGSGMSGCPVRYANGPAGTESPSPGVTRLFAGTWRLKVRRIRITDWRKPSNARERE